MSDNTKLVGKISSAQLLGIFGIGSLYDMRAYTQTSQSVTSVIIAGLDEWAKHTRKLKRISEPALQHALRVHAFYAPPPLQDSRTSRSSSSDPYVPVRRFPLWMVCNTCERLGRAGYQFDDRRAGNLCFATSCSGRGVPVRLITTCFAAPGSDQTTPHPGHIGEFPWHEWAHSNHREIKCSPDAPELRLVRSGRSAALSGLRVICLRPECKKAKVGRTLDGVFGDIALKTHSCGGHRPWLDDSESCGRPIRALMRGASNVYFPVTASALSIPPNSSACRQLVADNWHILRPTLDVLGLDAIDKKQIAEIMMNAEVRLRRYSHDQVCSAIYELNCPNVNNEEQLPTTSDEQRERERQAIVEGRSDKDLSGYSIFEAERVPSELMAQVAPAAAPLIEALVLLPRLREVRALRGFQRIEAQTGGDPYSAQCAPLSREALDWLPAIEIYGEGIYLELRKEKIDAWCQRPSVQDRVKTIVQRAGDATGVTPELVLIHTLAHLLINQLALDCGYSSSSLRERLYVGKNCNGDRWVGALIYTATSNSDGTLGGLVRQGKPDLFAKTLSAAIENATWCSSDPLCIESTGQGVNALNLAACHACAITTETSCENRNVLLDRALLVGTPEKPDAGFFFGTSLLDGLR